MDFNARTVLGGIVIIALATFCGVVGCELPADVVAPLNPPCWWHFTEEDYQGGPPDNRLCTDAGATD